MADHTIHILSSDDVVQALPMEQAIPLMQGAFEQLSSGRARVPLRTNMAADEHDAEALVMPVYLPEDGQIGVKVATINRRNPARGMPLIHALMMVADADTGRPLALMDAERLTALRTGAASGLATEMLARPEIEVAAIFGAGVQGRTQLEGVCAVRPIRRAYIVNPTAQKAEAFASEMSERLGIDVIPASAREALAEAGVVCTATTAREPVFTDAHLQPGTHINGIGSYRLDAAEVPPETVRRATVVVDHRASCLEEAGDLVQPMQDGLLEASHIHAELGEIVAGHKAGRTSADEITFFKSVGNAVQDLAAAAHVVAAARERGLGTEASL